MPPPRATTRPPACAVSCKMRRKASCSILRKAAFARARENLGNGPAFSLLDLFIQINELPGKLL